MISHIEIRNHKNPEKVRQYCEDLLERQFSKLEYITNGRLFLSKGEGVEPFEAKLEIRTKMGLAVFAHDSHANEHKVLDSVIKKAKRQLNKVVDKNFRH